MTDDQTNPLPDDTGDDAPLGGVSEAELDDMLAQAGELVDQLSTELGDSDTAPTSTTVEHRDEASSIASSLDDELAQLNTLTDTTTAEVIGTHETDTETRPDAEFADLFPGGFPPSVSPEVIEQALSGPAPITPASTDPAAAQWPMEDTPETSDDKDDAFSSLDAVEEPEPPQTRRIEESDTIPDFMKEFMEPEPEAEPEPNDASENPTTPPAPELETYATAMPVQTKPGVVGTGTLHQVVKKDPAPTSDTDEVVTKATTPRSGNPVVRILRGMLISILQRLKNTGPIKPVLAQAGYWICAKTVFALEKIDAPITGIGQRIRRVAGWVAMATIGTSAIVYVISFF